MIEDVVKRIKTEAMHFKKCSQSDEARTAFETFLARKA